jgi:long-chain acyl-CoA synthetase
VQMHGSQSRFWAQDKLGGELRFETHYDDRHMACFSERPAGLNAMFDELVSRFPDREAIVDGRKITYRELDEVVATIAANLAATGVAPGDRVAILLGNCWEFLASLLASLRLGAIAVPLGTRQRSEELQFALNDSSAKILIFEAELASNVPRQEFVPALEQSFFVHGSSSFGQPFSDLLARGRPVPAIHTETEEETAVILYTSGTTGRPKGARLTHLGIIHSALSFARCCGLGFEDRGLVAVPLSHVTGLVGVAFSTMIVGGAIVLMRQAYKTPDFLALAARERITYSILVPTIYTLCVMDPDLGSYDLSAWRCGCFGGAPMPVATIELLRKKLPYLTLINAYGATETTSPATIMPPAEGAHHADSVGQVVPCGEIKVMDENGQIVAPGEHGELWIKGPMVIPGYWQRPEANVSDFVDGFWRSGDIGSIDAEGFVRVFDRRKDMINRAGFKIFSAEVENVLSHHESVLECAIVGRPDPVLGERVHAFVVPRNGALISEEKLRAFCAARMSDYKVPETITIRQELLPRNANGKLQKGALRELAGQMPKAERHPPSSSRGA